MKNIITAIALLFTLLLNAQTDKQKVEETVKKNTLTSHIYFLADDLLEGRGTGTRGNKIAASYLANSLRTYGVQPNPKSGDYYQRFDLSRSYMLEKVQLSINGESYPDVVAFDADETDITEDAVYLNYGLEADYNGQNVKGKIVFVKAGTPESSKIRAAFGSRAPKRELAIKNGAKGLIEIGAFDPAIWPRFEHAFEEQVGLSKEVTDSLPMYLWVNTTQEKLSTLGKSGINLSIKTKGKQEEKISTQNIIGVVEGTDPILKNEYIMYSAHYDHVGIGQPDAKGDTIYNGARDNAIGTTAVLTMAENIGKHPTKRSAIFIFFTAEEKGLLGSSYYVEHPVLPLKEIVYGFNTDGGGYNNTELATIIGLSRTTAEKHIVKGAAAFGLKAIDDPAPEQGLFDRSDNVNFAKKGIPAPTYSTGFDAFDDEINKYYHQAGDEADSLDYEYLYKFFQGYAYSGRLIANDPVRPYWVKGDVYEAAGDALYGKNTLIKQ
ncbi:MAG: aminopeptidase YwaD [Flavobacteriales bacterium]|jgi:hypothetical protein